MKLILLGAPGAGKGTQAEILSKMLNIPTISPGNILRAAMKNGTPVGLKAKAYVESGKLVPDEVIIGIINERLAEADCAGGYILDGVPRTIPQAEALENAGIDIDCALSIEIADEVIVERMSGRRTCKDCSQTFHPIPPKLRASVTSAAASLPSVRTTLPKPSRHVSRSITERPSRSRRSTPREASSRPWTISPRSRRPPKLSKPLWVSDSEHYH